MSDTEKTSPEASNSPEDGSIPDKIESPLGQDLPPESEAIRILSDRADAGEEVSEAPGPERSSDEGSETPQEPESEDWKAKYEDLEQKHADVQKAVSMLESDPEVMDMILEHFRNKGTAVSDGPDDGKSAGGEDLSPREAELVRMVQQTQAQLAVLEFKSRTPDFEEHREAMAKEVQRNPGLTLDDAYQLAKAKSGKKSDETRTVPAAESRSSVSRRATGPADAGIEAKVAGAKDFDEAIRIAFEAAANDKSS